MFWIMKIFGLGMWVAILSMAIAAIVFKNGTKKDAATVYVAIMDFIVITVAAKTIMEISKRSS
jgi:sulfite exporter TauE/SafE